MFAVDQATRRIVAGPAHPVSCLQHHRPGLEEVEAVADVAGGVDGALLAAGEGEHDALVSHLRDKAGIAGLRTDAVDVMVKDGDIAFPVVGDVALLGAGQVEVDVALDLELWAVQHAMKAPPYHLCLRRRQHR